MSGHDWGTGDDRMDDLLRSTLHEEAETIMPAGDGLSKIQQQVLRRRRRERWLRPGLAIGSAAAVAAIAVGVYTATNHTNADRSRVITGGGSQTPHPTLSPTPSVVPITNVAFPKHAIFPFTSSADEKSWESGFLSGGHSPWKADPVAVATTWVTAYLQQPTVDQLVSKTVTPAGTAVVTLGRTMTAEQGQTVAVTDVHLVRFGKGWVVVGATDPQNQLKLSGPKAGSLAVSPLSVTGPGFGVDEAVRVQVRDAVSPKSYGEGTTGFGNGTPQWSVNVPFTRPSGRGGALVATMSSAADGGPSRIVAR
ncbi:MAG: hypothetical protein JO222_06700, partial [Frankiales bacterium]|nr:hypothetical protein [Frankiales bacterium]